MEWVVVNRSSARYHAAGACSMGVRHRQNDPAGAIAMQIIPTPHGRLRSISTRRQQAAVDGGQTEMAPRHGGGWAHVGRGLS